MSDSVVERINAWLQRQTGKWWLDTSVLDWAQDYGDDIHRAWRECPRADHLIALAGALEAPPWPVQQAVATAAREALVHVPSKLHQARRAVHYAESYRPHEEPSQPGASNLGKAADTTLGNLRRQVEQSEKALTASQRDAEKTWIAAQATQRTAMLSWPRL